MKKASFLAISKKGVIFTKPPLTKLTYLSLAINLITILGVISLGNLLPPEVPLFYGLAEGEEQLTTHLGLILPGLISTGVVAINFLIAALTQNSFLRQTLIVSAFAVSFLSFVTTLKIIFLVGSF